MPQAEVIAALSDLELGDVVDSIERIKHGLTNESWLVRAGNGAFVIRLSNTSEASLQINRHSEALILETVARAGIGPEVIRCDPHKHVLVTRYAGPTWTDAQATDSTSIDRIADLLRRLHALHTPPGVGAVNLLAVTQGYLRTLDDHGATPDCASPALRDRALRIASMLNTASTPRLCHNDVHALNIVDNGELRLIDWEYAGLGEVFFDLASACVYHAYSQEQRQQLLLRYAGSHESQAWHRLDLCCWLFAYIRDLWTAVRELQ